MGLGHMRRNLLLAQTLRHSRLQAVVLMIAGAREASLLTTTAGVDCVALPSLWKDGGGQYHPRHLAVSLEELLALRARTAGAALEAFAPDVLIVDNVPRGALRELDPVLESLRARGRTRLVLGLRDVLDEPATLQGEWARAQNQDAVRTYYDAIWVYGDPAVYDPVAALGWSGGRLALCLVGGGQDGAELAEAFVAADLPPDTNGLLVTGPCMPTGVRRRLVRSVASDPCRRVVSFAHEPTRLVRRADRVVAMGGYNTVYEVLSFDKPALIVPRVKPRREQLIRAERLQALGLVDVLHPEALSAAALSTWLARERAPVRSARERIDFNGLSRVPQLLEELLGIRPRPRPRRRVRAEVHHAA